MRNLTLSEILYQTLDEPAEKKLDTAIVELNKLPAFLRLKYYEVMDDLLRKQETSPISVYAPAKIADFYNRRLMQNISDNRAENHLFRYGLL